MIGRECDDTIVTGGENVFPQEVERTTLQYPGVVEAVVVGVQPDAEFRQRLAAAVVADPDRPLTSRELRSGVRDNLARFKIPRTLSALRVRVGMALG